MSETVGRSVVEANSIRMPPLFVILEQLAWRISRISGPLGRAKTRIDFCKRDQKRTAELQLQVEELEKELPRYVDLLEDCLAWLQPRTGLSRKQLRDVALMQVFENNGEYKKLEEFDQQGKTAELWRILWTDHRDMVATVKWPALETNLPAIESAADAGGQDGKAGDKQKRKSTGPRRTSEELFKAALRTHHCYEADGSVLNVEPISTRQIEKLVGVSDSTAGRLLRKHFGGVEKYRAACFSGAIKPKLVILMGDWLHASGTFNPAGHDAQDSTDADGE